MKVIRLNKKQWAVLFHVLNRYSAGWENAVGAAWEQDEVPPVEFARLFSQTLSCISNAEDEITPN